MKKYLFSCVLASILTQSATAVEFQEGFSGNLSIGVGARDIKSKKHQSCISKSFKFLIVFFCKKRD
ncbi:hypothetical protein EYI46_00920 [Campylobacter jejuni]|nr:hypothetical protein [Campylobacter jejuni]